MYSSAIVNRSDPRQCGCVVCMCVCVCAYGENPHCCVQHVVSAWSNDKLSSKMGTKQDDSNLVPSETFRFVNPCVSDFLSILASHKQRMCSETVCSFIIITERKLPHSCKGDGEWFLKSIRLYSRKCSLAPSSVHLVSQHRKWCF